MGRIIKARIITKSTHSNDNDICSDPSWLKKSAIELACSMVENIIGIEIDKNPIILERVFSKALILSKGFANAEITVHPDDRVLFDIDSVAAEAGFVVRSSEAVGRAGCRIIGKQGEIDASISAIIEAFHCSMQKIEN